MNAFVNKQIKGWQGISFSSSLYFTDPKVHILILEKPGAENWDELIYQSAKTGIEFLNPMIPVVFFV